MGVKRQVSSLRNAITLNITVCMLSMISVCEFIFVAEKIVISNVYKKKENLSCLTLTERKNKKVGAGKIRVSE